MSWPGRPVVMTVVRQRKQVLLSGRDLVDLVDLADIAGLAYRTTGSGSLIVQLEHLADIEAACAVRHRPVRIQSRRTATA